MRAGIDEAAAALAVAVWNPQQEICPRIVRRKETGTIKGEATVIPIGERIAHVEAASIEAELQGVPSYDIAEVVVSLIDLVDARLRPVIAESKVEETS